ncbi:MAG: ATP-binding cassette subfamily F protein uup [Patiriisocius sp.]
MFTNCATFVAMNYLSIEDVSKSFGIKKIYQNLSFGLDKGDKMALIARNGTGKSTLLKGIANIDPPDSGKIIFRNDIKVGYLAQEQFFDPEANLMETLFEGDSPVLKAIKKYEEVLAKGDMGEEYQHAFDEMDKLKAWDYESRVKQILFQLQLEDLQQKTGTLSGGQKKRLGLAKELINDPDLLILDEPTNHLDIEMIEWLESYFVKTGMTLLLVTHDRFFLDKVCNVILELDGGEMFRYKGNYTYFLEKKAERESLQEVVTAKAKKLMNSELDWLRRQPKARTTKSKSRISAFDDIKDRASKKVNKDKVTLDINVTRMGSKTVEFHNVGKTFDGKEIIRGLNYTFLREERVGIIGKNGSGKSTILNLITGLIEPDTGKVVIGDTVSFGYYTQSGIKFKPEARVIEAVRDIADVIPMAGGRKITAAEMLERFLFPRSMHFDFIRTLSGGEKRRLYLLTVLMKNPNFLILDEPTNDLDIYTLNVLEDYLLDFKGVVVVVSHDRHFMDKVVEHSFVLEDNLKFRDFPGNYSQYKYASEQEKKNEKKPVANREVKSTSNQNSVKTKLTYAEKIEYEKLENEIELIEQQKVEITETLSEIQDSDELVKLSLQLGDLDKELDAKSERWIELAEYL